jgi:hypothetical protein
MPDPRPWLIGALPVLLAVIMVETIVRHRRISKRQGDLKKKR